MKIALKGNRKLFSSALKYTFKKTLLQMLSIAYWALNFIYLLCLLYVFLKYFEDEVPYIKRTSTYIPDVIKVSS